jgi:predicted alpha/beta hydrolase family esterase
MKKALILHGTKGYPAQNWFIWLKNELENKGYKVWLPQLPQADFPNITRYNKFISENKPWDLDDETILIGHSSGAVEILGLLNETDTKVGICILVGVFKDDLDWENLKGLFEKPFDFEKIKNQAKKFIFIHSDDDPYCPLDHARFLVEKLNGQLVIMPGFKHFSISTGGERFKQFPEILEFIQ